VQVRHSARSDLPTSSKGSRRLMPTASRCEDQSAPLFLGHLRLYPPGAYHVDFLEHRILFTPLLGRFQFSLQLEHLRFAVIAAIQLDSAFYHVSFLGPVDYC
jgi:hypothetical protein